jgi:REP element-mobilizing transposase RayT
MSTYQQLLYHVVFSTKERKPLLQREELRTKLWPYMAGIAENLGGHAVKIGGHCDHAHALLRIPAKIAVADFVGRFKANASRFVNEQGGPYSNFHWQDGYGAFSVSHSMAEVVADYIERQEEHHRKMSFKEEFIGLLKKHEVDFDPLYIWR